MVQAIALGDLNDVDEGREVVRRSFPQTEYLPRRDARWEDAYERFQNGLRPKKPASRS
jgi:rhamnulokinase